MSSTPRPSPPAGWYDIGGGRNRWFDGVQWSGYYRLAETASRA
ncbi:hypothetical protein [Paeniglutamicibacter sp.]